MRTIRFTAGRGLALLLAAIVVLSVLPGTVVAETRSGGTIVVGPGETVSGGLEAFAGDILVQGTVRGDLNAFAGDVTIAEGARVTGSVNAFGGSILVAGEVGGDLSGAAGSITLAETGSVAGDLSGGAGAVDIAGAVDGDVAVGAETVVLRETARVGGEVRYDAGSFQNEGAVVDGRIVRDQSLGQVQIAPPVVPEFVFGVYAFLVNLVLGAVLLLAFPAFSGRVTRYARTEPLRSGGVGLLTLVGVPVVLVLLLVTIVGIPLSLVGFVLFGLFAWVAAVFGRIAVGEWLTSLADVENRWLSLVVGLLAVAVLVRVPLVGGVFDFVVLLLGLGALASVLYRSYRGRSDEPAAPEESGSVDEGARPA